jgi:hypothetical protein
MSYDERSVPAATPPKQKQQSNTHNKWHAFLPYGEWNLDFLKLIFKNSSNNRIRKCDTSN